MGRVFTGCGLHANIRTVGVLVISVSSTSVHSSTKVLGFTLPNMSAVLFGHRSMRTGQEEAACAPRTCLLMFSVGLSPSDLLITPSSLPCPFALSPQLGCATTRCCVVRTVARATTTSDAIVPLASRASCARELAARGPGSVMTNCLDGPPSIIPPSAASSRFPS